MKLIKRCLIYLLSLSMLIILPVTNVFADENDGIMVIGQPISSSLSKNETYLYDDKTPSYVVQYRASVSYERSKNSYGKYYVSNVKYNSISVGVDDSAGPQDYYSAQVKSYSYTLYNGNSTRNAYLRVNVIVQEKRNGAYYEVPHYYDFYL